MSAYYFLVASLPMLQRDARPPFTSEVLWEKAAPHLRPRHRHALRALLDGKDDAHPFVKTMRDAETQIRNAVVRHRARRSDRDPAPYLRPVRGYRGEIESGVDAAFTQSDPLNREFALDSLRWTLAGEIQGHDLFGEAALFAYAVKLEILGKQARVNAERGREKIEKFLRNAFAEGRQAEAS